MFSCSFSYLFSSQHGGRYTHSHSIKDLRRTQATGASSANKNRGRARKACVGGQDQENVKADRSRLVPETCSYMRTIVIWEENTVECLVGDIV